MNKINYYQNDEKRNVWQRKGTARDPQHAKLSVKHGRDKVCIVAKGTELYYADSTKCCQTDRPWVPGFSQSLTTNGCQSSAS